MEKDFTISLVSVRSPPKQPEMLWCRPSLKESHYEKTWILMLLCALLSYSSIEAQGVKLSLIGAVSKEVGPEHERFNWGFSVGAIFLLCRR